MDEYENLREEIDEHRYRAPSAQTDEDTVIGRMIFMIYLVAEDPVAYRSFEDHHGKSGKDAGNEEQDGDKLGIP